MRAGRFKRGILASVLGAVLALAGVSPALAVDTEGVDVVSSTSKVTVHVYDGTTGGSGDGSKLEDTSALGNPVSGATLGYVKIGKLVQYTNDGDTALKYAVKSEAATALGLTGGTEVTIDSAAYRLYDAADLTRTLAGKTSSSLATTFTYMETGATPTGGSVEVSDLSGLYLFVGKTMPANVSTEVVPFIVSAPLPGEDGTWNSDIHVYPKVQIADAITIDKEVAYKGDSPSFAKSMSANSNTTLTYRIVVSVPQDVQNLDKLVVSDPAVTGIRLAAQPNLTVTATGVTLEAGDYTTSTAGRAVTVTLNSAGLEKFDSEAAGSTITITYDAYLDDAATLASAVTNTAKLTYSYEGNAADTGDTTSASVYAYGIDLTKTFKGADAYKVGAKFTLYTDADCTISVGVTGTAGTYWVTSNTTTTEMEVARDGDGTDGALTLKGLAAGTYYLKETAAPDGYNQLQEPIKIVVSPGSGADLDAQLAVSTATVNDAAATIGQGLVQLSVENAKSGDIWGLLPATGEAGTILLVAVGIGLVCVTVVYASSHRRGSRA